MITLKEKIIEQYNIDPNFDRAKFARDNNCGERYVRKIVRGLKLTEAVSWSPTPEDTKILKDIKNDSYFININSVTINTLDDAILAADVDLNKWKVERHTISSSQVTLKLKKQVATDSEGQPIYEDRPKTLANWHIKIWLKLNPTRHVESAIKRLISTVPRFAYKDFKPINYGKKSSYAGIMALMDAHIGKFAWGAELNGRDYDLKIARNDYLYCTRENLSYMSPFKPEIIYYILGQDFTHTENYPGTTPNGRNILDYDTRLPKIIYRAKEIAIKSIMDCRKVAPVEVIWIPGNHDKVASLLMAHVLDAFFKDDKHVNVDYSPSVRKARLWGKTLIGWTHSLTGKHHSWANELAQAFPDEWAKSNYREWHHGHKHKKGEVKTFPIVTQGGVTMRQLTALSPIDAWHYENLYTDAIPGGEAFILHKEKGVVANFTSWTDSLHENKKK